MKKTEIFNTVNGKTQDLNGDVFQVFNDDTGKIHGLDMQGGCVVLSRKDFNEIIDSLRAYEELSKKLNQIPEQ